MTMYVILRNDFFRFSTNFLGILEQMFVLLWCCLEQANKTALCCATFSMISVYSLILFEAILIIQRIHRATL